MASTERSSPPRQFPTTGFELVEDLNLLEEESFSWFDPDKWYLVRIGEEFASKYQMLGKTWIWLCVHGMALS
jgi:hypothetical protein